MNIFKHKNDYYYLMSSLEELKFDMDLKSFSLEEVLATIKEGIKPSDYHLIEIILSEKQQKDYINFIYEFKIELGQTKGDYIEYLEKTADAGEEYEFEAYESFDYVKKFRDEFFAKKQDTSTDIIKTMLFDIKLCFYKYVEAYPVKVFKKWFSLDRLINNIAVLHISREYEKDLDGNYIYYKPEEKDILEWVKKHFSSSDFELPKVLDISKSIFEILDDNNILERERRMDLFKWYMLDDLGRNSIFNINAILVYVLKAMILNRWKLLDKVEGEMKMQEKLSSLRNVSFEGE